MLGLKAKDWRLILASASPRRSALLTESGIPFCVVAPEVDEQHQAHESPEEYVTRNADIKAEWVRVRTALDGAIGVLAADTVVVVNGRILEKPRDLEEAASMLKSLSGLTHRVLTGVSLLRVQDGAILDRCRFVEETSVRFRDLSASDIASYLATGEPMDKAGAYAIQGQGAALVDAIEGDFANVVGLPVERVVRTLQAWA